MHFRFQVAPAQIRSFPARRFVVPTLRFITQHRSMTALPSIAFLGPHGTYSHQVRPPSLLIAYQPLISLP